MSLSTARTHIQAYRGNTAFEPRTGWSRLIVIVIDLTLLKQSRDSWELTYQTMATSSSEALLEL